MRKKCRQHFFQEWKKYQGIVCFENWNADDFFIYACGALVCKSCHCKCYDGAKRIRCITCHVFTGDLDHILSGPMAIIAKEIQNDKLVQCDYDECNAQMLMEDLYKHQDQCLYKKISCMKCKQEFFQMDKMVHSFTCECRDTICEDCHEMYPWNKSQEHSTICPSTICPNGMMTCTCKTILMRKDFPIHEEICDFTIVYCTHDRCSRRGMFRKDIKHHKTQCEFEWITCDHCNEEMQRQDLLYHLTRFGNSMYHSSKDMCSEYPYRCDGCCKKIPMKYLAKHALQECQKRSITIQDVSKPLEIGMVVTIKNPKRNGVWIKYLIVGNEKMGIFYCVLLVGDNQFLPNIRTMLRSDVAILCREIKTEPLLIKITDLCGIACTPDHKKTIDIDTGASYYITPRWTQESECYAQKNLIASCDIIQTFPNFYRVRFQSQDFFVYRTQDTLNDLCLELKIGRVYTILFKGQYYDCQELESIDNGFATFKYLEIWNDQSITKAKLCSVSLDDCKIYPFNFLKH